MKITREEFKEFTALYESAYNKFSKLVDTEMFTDGFLDEMLFPLFDWVEAKLGGGEDSLIFHFACGDGVHRDDGTPIETVDEFYDDMDSKYKEIE